MSEKLNIKINNFILHILDVNAEMPILSEMEHPLDDDEIKEFISGHIVKLLEDKSTKKAYFTTDNKIKNMCKDLASFDIDLKDFSKEIAYIMYKNLKQNPDIPSGDLLCILFEIDGILHLGVLKFNYKESYIHYIEYNDESRVNKIIKQRTALPGDKQKIDEGIIINLSDLSINILEKRYEIDGKKEYYLSTKILECSSLISDKEKVKKIKQSIKSFNKEYFDEDFSKSMDIKKAFKENIDEKGMIDIPKVAETAFGTDSELKKSYIEHVKKIGLTEDEIEIDRDYGEKIFNKQKLKTDTGIEINLPTDYYNDNEKLEFINNPDGTISILLKNIGKIVDK